MFGLHKLESVLEGETGDVEQGSATCNPEKAEKAPTTDNKDTAESKDAAESKEACGKLALLKSLQRTKACSSASGASPPASSPPTAIPTLRPTTPVELSLDPTGTLDEEGLPLAEGPPIDPDNRLHLVRHLDEVQAGIIGSAVCPFLYALSHLLAICQAHGSLLAVYTSTLLLRIAH